MTHRLRCLVAPVAACALLIVPLLLAQPPDDPPPKDKFQGFGKGPGGGFGGPMGQKRKVVERFDKNGDGWLNAEERAVAREAIKKEGGNRGGFGKGGPGGKGGFGKGGFGKAGS